MRIIYFFCTIPFYLCAKFFQLFNILKIEDDLKKCLSDLDNSNKNLDYTILEILSLAEDHRVKFHYGIDHYAMLRAIYYTHIKNEFQGASTIAQQYVRVISNRYERTLIRKFREQLLAVLITRCFHWEEIAAAYINTAFLGSGMYGYDSFLKRKKILEADLSMTDKVGLVARLKYPEPLQDKIRWSSKMRVRVENIQSKIVKM